MSDIKVKIGKGNKDKYTEELHKEYIYFAEDTKEILVDNKTYGSTDKPKYLNILTDKDYYQLLIPDNKGIPNWNLKEDSLPLIEILDLHHLNYSTKYIRDNYKYLIVSFSYTYSENSKLTYFIEDSLSNFEDINVYINGIKSEILKDEKEDENYINLINNEDGLRTNVLFIGKLKDKDINTPDEEDVIYLLPIQIKNTLEGILNIQCMLSNTEHTIYEEIPLLVNTNPLYNFQIPTIYTDNTLLGKGNYNDSLKVNKDEVQIKWDLIK